MGIVGFIRSRPVRMGLLVLAILLVAFIALAVSVIVPFTRFAGTADGLVLSGGTTLVAAGAANVYILSDADGRVALVDCGADAEAAGVRVS